MKLETTAERRQVARVGIFQMGTCMPLATRPSIGLKIKQRSSQDRVRTATPDGHFVQPACWSAFPKSCKRGNGLQRTRLAP